MNEFFSMAFLILAGIAAMILTKAALEWAGFLP